MSERVRKMLVKDGKQGVFLNYIVPVTEIPELIEELQKIYKEEENAPKYPEWGVDTEVEKVTLQLKYQKWRMLFEEGNIDQRVTRQIWIKSVNNHRYQTNIQLTVDYQIGKIYLKDDRTKEQIGYPFAIKSLTDILLAKGLYEE